MVLDRSFIEAAFWASLIISSPGFFLLSRALTRHFINKFVPLNTVVITHVHNGVVIARREVKVTGYVIDQLESLKGDSHE